MTAPVAPSPTVAGPPRAADRRPGIGILPIVLLVIAVLCAVAGVLAYRHGVAASPFPSAIDGAPVYAVNRYSGPWVVGGTVLAGAALPPAIVGIALAVRRRRGPVLTRPDVTDEW